MYENNEGRKPVCIKKGHCENEGISTNDQPCKSMGVRILLNVYPDPADLIRFQTPSITHCHAI